MKKELTIAGLLCLLAAPRVGAQESFRYPYVYNGNSNIIVSRESQGGVREENIRNVDENPWVTVQHTTNDDTETSGTVSEIIHVTPIHDEQDENNSVASMFEVGEVPGDTDALIARSAVLSSQYCATEYKPGEVWRMPTQRELMLIYVMNDELASPLKTEKEKAVQNYYEKHFTQDDVTDKVDENGDAKNTFYWSATRYTPGDAEWRDAWSVCFSSSDQPTMSGQTTGYAKTTENFVRCVRDVKEVGGQLFAADKDGNFTIQVGNNP